jgi:hypothetical protein
MMNNLCEKCKGMCCVGKIEVEPTDQIPEQMHHNGYMVVRSNNTCIALVNGKCIIYKDRPAICKKFKVLSPCCKDFFIGSKTKHKCERYVYAV